MIWTINGGDYDDHGVDGVFASSAEAVRWLDRHRTSSRQFVEPQVMFLSVEEKEQFEALQTVTLHFWRCARAGRESLFWDLLYGLAKFAAAAA